MTRSFYAIRTFIATHPVSTRILVMAGVGIITLASALMTGVPVHAGDIVGTGH